MFDYRFAWRQLLPWKPGQRPYLSGFDQAERAFWCDELGFAELVDDPWQAEGWIIDAERASVDPAPAHGCPVPEIVQWVVIVGSGASVRRWRRRLPKGFATVREYGLLPPDNPRIAVPLENSRHSAIALSLHRPGRWFARLAVRLAGTAARMGVLLPVRRRALLIATRDRHVWPMGAVGTALPTRLKGTEWDFALYFGTPDDNRKTTILPLGASEPDVLVKTGSSRKARRALKNEASALAFLRDSPLCVNVPALKGLVDNEHAVALYQEYRAGRPVRSQTMKRAVVDFLVGLSKLDRRTRSLREVLEETDVAVSGEQDGHRSDQVALRRWLRSRADKGAEILEHRCHGDFTPWNCSWTDRGLFVFDWEASRETEPAFSDAFSYVVIPAALISDRSSDQQKITQSARHLALSIAEKAVVRSVDIGVYWALWLLRCSRFKGLSLFGRLLQGLARNRLIG